MLEFQDVKWQLPSGEPIIKGIICKLDSRLTVITGPNGGGKTSLAKLIAGVEKCTSGKILLDGTDITDMDITGRQSWHCLRFSTAGTLQGSYGKRSS